MRKGAAFFPIPSEVVLLYHTKERLWSCHGSLKGRIGRWFQHGWGMESSELLLINCKSDLLLTSVLSGLFLSQPLSPDNHSVFFPQLHHQTYSGLHPHPGVYAHFRWCTLILFSSLLNRCNKLFCFRNLKSLFGQGRWWEKRKGMYIMENKIPLLLLAFFLKTSFVSSF